MRKRQRSLLAGVFNLDNFALLDTMKYRSPECYGPDLEELMFLKPSERTIPFRMSLDHDDVQHMTQQTTALMKSIQNKRVVMNDLLASLSQLAKGSEKTLEDMDNVTCKGASKLLLWDSIKSSLEPIYAVGDVKPPKEVAQEHVGITKDLGLAHHQKELALLNLLHPPPSNVDGSTPTTLEVGKLEQQMFSHMSTHRQMWSKQQDQLLEHRVIPVQSDTENTVFMNSEQPLTSAFVQQLRTDFLTQTNPLVQSTGMPSLNSSASGNLIMKNSDVEFDFNIEELDDELFQFLM